jgi:hypothetical protein
LDDLANEVIKPLKTTKTGSALRAATQRRVNRQATAVADTVRAWQALRDAEESGGETGSAMLALRNALDNLQHEMEN